MDFPQRISPTSFKNLTDSFDFEEQYYSTKWYKPVMLTDSDDNKSDSRRSVINECKKGSRATKIVEKRAVQEYVCS